MRYEVTVLQVVEGKKIRLFSLHLNAADSRAAIEKAGFEPRPDRIIESRNIRPLERPPVNRLARDGLS